MKTAIMKTQAGFSLVELMVVVAIIGILASMSAGQVQKQIAKARQSEAKTNLATVYTSLKAFQAEWSSYTTDLGTAGVGFDGNMRYTVGFAANSVPVAGIAGYTGAAGTLAFAANAGACPGAFGLCTVIATGGRAPTASAGVMNAAASPQTFSATASADIYSTTDDTWAISENKILSQTSNGIL